MVNPGSHRRRPVAVQINSAEELITAGEQLGGAVFRGHGSTTWSLTSTLERAAARWNVERSNLVERERTLLNSFQRAAHHYVADVPPAAKLLEWTALLQHYGGPTRLLDVTRSYLAATFFAIEKADGDGIVWAFNSAPLQTHPEPEGPRTPDSANLEECESALSGEGRGSGIRLVEPFRLNRRLVIQRGAFLMPLSLDTSFQEQMECQLQLSLRPENFKKEVDAQSVRDHVWSPVKKLIIPQACHSEIMRFLSRSNITAATLFEGLDGFARSLHTQMRIFD